MKFSYLAVLVVVLFMLSACAGDETPVPEAAPAPKSTESAKPESAKPRLTPCKVQNVDSQACTDVFAKKLAVILSAQGSSAEWANRASAEISTAIQSAPFEKRNGFRVTDAETGRRFTFIFENMSGQCHLVLFTVPEAGAANQEPTIITAESLPDCMCVE